MKSAAVVFMPVITLARWIDTWRLETIGFACVVAAAVIVAGGNGSHVWWGGLLPTLILGPIAILCLRFARTPHGLPILHRWLPIVLVASCVTSLASMLLVAPNNESFLFWASAYLSPLILYVAVSAAPLTQLRVELLLGAVAIGAAVPLATGLVAYYQAWGIPTGLEFLVSRYDLVRMAGYMAATFGNTSNTAAYLALVFPTLLSVCVQRAPVLRIRGLAWVVLILALLHVLIVQSRTLLLVLFPTVVIAAYFHGLRFRRTFLILLVAVAAVVLPALSALDRLMELTFGAVRGSEGDESVSERVDAMRAGWRLLVDNFPFGIGPNRAVLENPFTSAHQFWVQQGSELGYIGLLLAVALTVGVCISFARLLIRERGSAQGNLRFTLMVGPVAYFVYGAIANMPLAQNQVNAWIGTAILCLGAAAAVAASPSDQRVTRGAP